MSSVLYYIFLISTLLVGINIVYLFVFAIASLFYSEKGNSSSNSNQAHSKRFALLVPGYKEDDVILEVARNLSQIDYSNQFFDVYIIADSFSPNTLEALSHEDVKVIEVSFEKSTKSKSLNQAFSVIDKKYDYAIIMDADNIVNNSFLSQIASFSEKTDFEVLQCHRVAKNKNTPIAILDAISEEINNSIFRKGHIALRLSSSLIGSGMVFKYPLIKDLMENIEAVGGFDKELELKMLKREIHIDYLNSCLVYDEKVQKTELLTNQRRRWLSAQFVYFKSYIIDALLSFVTKFNLDYLDKALQMALIPRILLIGITPVMGFIAFILDINTDAWAIINIMLIIAMFISIPRRMYNKDLVNAIAYLPLGVFAMIKSVLKLKGANQSFIHTPHSSSTNAK